MSNPMINCRFLPRLLAFCLGLVIVTILPSQLVAQSTEKKGEPQVSSGQDPDVKETEEEPAESDRPPRGFGGPDQVDRRIEEDEISISRVFDKGLIAPYLGWKKSLAEKYGLSFGVDYSTAYLGASYAPPGAEDRAGSGMGRFYGSWDLVGRKSGNAGAFVWKVEHRHRYSDIPVSSLGFDLGYIGLLEPPFNNQGLRWTNLYWRQRWKNGKISMLAGFVDATDYVDIYALASPWTGFLNFAFSTGTLTMAIPNDAALGFAAGGMLTKNVFLIGGIVDRNSDPKAPLVGFGTFFKDTEHFKSVEIGWTSSQDRIALDNAHLTFWHSDERIEAGEAGGWGLNASFSRQFADKWLPFIRGGYAKEGDSLMQNSVSVGFGYQPVRAGDLFGFGFNWGEPNEDTFGPGLRDQYTMEIFYRWQLTPRLAITPDVQLLINPALDTSTDDIWLLGFRARLAL